MHKSKAQLIESRLLHVFSGFFGLILNFRRLKITKPLNFLPLREKLPASTRSFSALRCAISRRRILCGQIR